MRFPTAVVAEERTCHQARDRRGPAPNLSILVTSPRECWETTRPKTVRMAILPAADSAQKQHHKPPHRLLSTTSMDGSCVSVCPNRADDSRTTPPSNYPRRRSLALCSQSSTFPSRIYMHTRDAGQPLFAALPTTCFVRRRVFLAVPANCLLYTSPSPRDKRQSRMPSSA